MILVLVFYPQGWANAMIKADKLAVDVHIAPRANVGCCRVEPRRTESPFCRIIRVCTSMMLVPFAVFSTSPFTTPIHPGTSLNRIRRGFPLSVCIAPEVMVRFRNREQKDLMAKELSVEAEQFRNRAIDREYPIIIVDALYEKVRENGRVD